MFIQPSAKVIFVGDRKKKDGQYLFAVAVCRKMAKVIMPPPKHQGRGETRAAHTISGA